MPVASVPRRCPCGSGLTFPECCGPILEGAPAPTPERLMRSRYTAFALGDVDHVRDTWHPGRRPDDLALDPEIRWSGLEILDAPPPTPTRGTVAFRATFVAATGRGVLAERSRFVFQSGRWWYLDGIVEPGPGTPGGS